MWTQIKWPPTHTHTHTQMHTHTTHTRHMHAHTHTTHARTHTHHTCTHTHTHTLTWLTIQCGRRHRWRGLLSLPPDSPLVSVHGHTCTWPPPHPCPPAPSPPPECPPGPPRPSQPRGRREAAPSHTICTPDSGPRYDCPRTECCSMEGGSELSTYPLDIALK